MRCLYCGGAEKLGTEHLVRKITVLLDEGTSWCLSDGHPWGSRKDSLRPGRSGS